MRWLDRPLLATIAFAVVLTASLGALQAMTPQSTCTGLVVASSLEKASLMQQVAQDFNAKSALTAGCVRVSVEPVASGAAEAGLRAAWPSAYGDRPDVWSPAASAWLELSKEHRSTQGLAPLADTINPSLFQSPLVVALPEPMARALGWPGRSLGWSDIYQLAEDPQGWARYGHPEWGRFRLGKTNPNISTSGLHALVGTYLAATGGKTSDLATQDLQDPKVVEFVKGVESSVVHYGDTAFTFLTNLRAADQRGKSLSYVSAIAVEEKEVWNYNRGNVTGDPALGPTSLPPHVLLAAVYPKEGTLFADHPYAVLNAPWVTDAKRSAATRFLEYLLAPKSQSRFQSQGFRDRFGAPTPTEISARYNLDPSKPSTVLRLPPPQILAAIQASWTSLRKRARVLVLVDVATASGGATLSAIGQSLTDSLAELADDDQVGLSVTPGSKTSLDELVRIGPLATTRTALKSKIGGLTAKDGPAALIDAVHQGLALLGGAGFDATRIEAIVLISNGRTSSPVDDLLRELQAQPPDRVIRVFTMAYGNQPDTTALTRIALASEAGYYRADSPGAFNSLLLSVLSNF